MLGGVSSAVPSLLEAYKLSSRAAHVGFDWPEIDGLFEKLEEETGELREEVAKLPAPVPRRGAAPLGHKTCPKNCTRAWKTRVGDLFFVLVNLARYLSAGPNRR